MFRHHDVSDQRKRMPDANFVKRVHEAIAGVWRSKQRTPAETSEGDEVKVAISITALKLIAHERKPAPLKPTRVRHPSLLSPDVYAGMMIYCS